MTVDELKTEVQKANLVLAGIGEDISGNQEEFYKGLSELLLKKDYFIVTLQGREGLEQAGLISEKITAPFSEGEDSKTWEKYLHWLSYTLNQKLLILELGVGFEKPQVIRFPFEKVCILNQKSRYIRIHEHFPQLSESIAPRGLSVKENPAEILKNLLR